MKRLLSFGLPALAVLAFGAAVLYGCESFSLAPSAETPLGGLSPDTIPPVPGEDSPWQAWVGFGLATIFAWLAPQPRRGDKDDRR